MQPISRIHLLVALIAILLTPTTWADRGNERSPHRPRPARDAPAGLVIFGDSLSDTGNKFFDTGLLNRPPYDQLDAFLVPDGPYARGGLTHSNGAVWVQQYARPLGLGGDTRPSLAPRKPGSNYAYGGARARGSSTAPNRHLPDQVSDFMADVNYSPSGEPLYVLFIGGNDITDAVRALATDPSGATSVGIVVEALTSIAGAIQTLYNHAAGAREFLVFNAPDLGLTPAFNPPLNIPQAAAFGSCFTLLFNLGGDESSYPAPYDFICAAFGFPDAIPGFDSVIAGLQAALPGTRFTRIDSFALFHDMVANPDTYRLRDVTDPCIMPNVPPYACSKPDSYLFWDGIHPTRRTHAIIADKVADVIPGNRRHADPAGRIAAHTPGRF